MTYKVTRNYGNADEVITNSHHKKNMEAILEKHGEVQLFDGELTVNDNIEIPDYQGALLKDLTGTLFLVEGAKEMIWKK